MSKISVNDLSGRALDYAVAMAEGATHFWFDTVATYWVTINGKDLALSSGWAASMSFAPSSSSVGDDIIDREGISVIRCDDDYGRDAEGFYTSERIPVWAATVGQHSSGEIHGPQGDYWGLVYTLDVSDVIYGATRREAALRLFVSYKLGMTIEIPKELA